MQKSIIKQWNDANDVNIYGYGGSWIKVYAHYAGG
jgi:hypothetical protein